MAFPLDRVRLALLHEIAVFVGLDVALSVTGERTWKTRLPAFGVVPTGSGSLRMGVTIFLGRVLLLSLLKLVVDAHNQDAALHGSRQDVDEPGAPAFKSKSTIQARGEEETSGGLDAHHGYAQAADMLETPSRVNLRYVLDRGQETSTDAEEISPGIQVLGQGQVEDSSEDDNNKSVKDAQKPNRQGGAPTRSFHWHNISVVSFSLSLLNGLVAEENQKENETKTGLVGVIQR